MAPAVPGFARRPSGKRALVLAAARAEFAEHGYRGTSMDGVAARAGVSKQTIYAHFGGKEALFDALVTEAIDVVTRALAEATTVPADGDREEVLRTLGHRLVGSIMSPDVLTLRRLLIAESARFPELGRRYFEEGFEPGIESITATLRAVGIDTPGAGARFAGMLMWVPANRAMFTGDGLRRGEANRLVDQAVAALLAAESA